MENSFLPFDQVAIKNIPDELKKLQKFVSWAAEEQARADGTVKVGKKPISPAHGNGASSTDPACWVSFDQAVEYTKEHGLTGVMFTLSADLPYTGIDLDDCRNPRNGEIESWAMEIIKKLGTYTEVSPSGTGVKMIVRGKTELYAGHRPKNNPKLKDHVEVYDQKRFWCMTGMRVEGTPETINDRQKELAEFYAEVFGAKVKRTSVSGHHEQASAAHEDIDAMAGRIKDALKHIECDTYENWMEIGLALKHWSINGGDDRKARELWDEWSSRSGKYDKNGQDKLWANSKSSVDRPITITSIFYRAEKAGWVSMRHGLPAVRLPKTGGSSIVECAEKLAKLLAPILKVFNVSQAVSMLKSIVSDRKTIVIVEDLKPEKAASVFETVATLKTIKGNKLVDAVCTTEQARQIQASDAFLQNLPEIKRLTNCPVLVKRDDGGLEIITGYDAKSKIYAQGDPPVPCNLEEARAYVDELIGEFLFVTPSDKTRAIASLLTPAIVMGEIFSDKHPATIIEAAKSQSGKDYLVSIIAAVYNDIPASVCKKEGGVGSIEETFDTAVLQGRQFINFANVRGKLDCQKLESFLSEELYYARVPYREPKRVESRGYNVTLTSNRAELTTDLANRAMVVRIRKQPPGYKFREYPEGHLLDHVRAASGKYLGAVFAVVRAWAQQGCPRCADAQHDYRDWARVMDWICQKLLGLTPLCQGHDDIKQRISIPYGNWLRDLANAVLEDSLHGRWLTATDLLETMKTHGLDIPGHYDKDGSSETGETKLKQLGIRLKRVFGEGSEVQVDDIKIIREVTVEPKNTDSGSSERKKYMFVRVAGGGNSAGLPAKPQVQLTGAAGEPQYAAIAAGAGNNSQTTSLNCGVHIEKKGASCGSRRSRMDSPLIPSSTSGAEEACSRIWSLMKGKERSLSGAGGGSSSGGGIPAKLAKTPQVRWRIMSFKEALKRIAHGPDDKYDV